MRMPTVSEIRSGLEPVTADPFVEALPSAAPKRSCVDRTPVRRRVGAPRPAPAGSWRPRSGSPAAYAAAGGMFWLSRKTLSGS